MRTDVAFQIGKTHDICQDFALSGVFESTGGDCHYAVVSDGCSSSPHVDLGARILTFSIVSELKNLYRNSANLMFCFNSSACISMARASIEALKISPSSLDATALIAYVDDDLTSIVIKGDGCIAIGLPDKRILVMNIEFPSNHPFYMNYLPEYSNRYGQWYRLNQEEKECTITSSIINTDGTFEELDKECSPHFTFSPDKETTTFTIKQKIHGGVLHFFTDSDKRNPPEFIVLMSDGISSFYQEKNTGTSLTNHVIDYRTAIHQVLGFKNFNGKFMQRRLNRFLKYCVKNNWYHSDDISFGAIHFGD